jgi:L-amino acid N-acyltransferase YncA
MVEWIKVDTVAQLEGYQDFKGLRRLSSADYQMSLPDAHWILVREEAIAAHCSLWWRHVPTNMPTNMPTNVPTNVPTEANHTLGLIGHYAADGNEAAQHLLNHVCDQLAQQGCTQAIAPINGSTWQSYRLICQRGEEPIFFLEPDHPDEYPQQFQDQGFSVLATYRSTLTTNLLQREQRMDQVEQRLSDRGVRIRSLNLQQFEQELEKVYHLSIISFRQNFLYTPIHEQAFLAQYRQVKAYLSPDLILMAEQDNQLVGFIFAIPDLCQAQRDQAIDTVVIKTAAVLPGRAYAGLGNLLLVKVQEIAHALGYRRAIHALMHDGNHSRNISDRYAATIRQYALFTKALVP